MYHTIKWCIVFLRFDISFHIHCDAGDAAVVVVVVVVVVAIVVVLVRTSTTCSFWQILAAKSEDARKMAEHHSAALDVEKGFL